MLDKLDAALRFQQEALNLRAQRQEVLAANIANADTPGYQATGNYVVAAMPIARGGKLEAGNVKLKRGRLDTLPPRTVLDINQLVDAISLRDLSPDQPIQLTQFRQAWRVKAGQRVNVIASGDGFSANAEGQALNNAAVAQNARVRMVSGQVVSGVVDADGNILINL